MLLCRHSPGHTGHSPRGSWAAAVFAGGALAVFAFAGAGTGAGSTSGAGAVGVHFEQSSRIRCKARGEEALNAHGVVRLKGCRLLSTKGVMGSTWDISVLVQLQHVLSNFFNKLWSSKMWPVLFQEESCVLSGLGGSGLADRGAGTSLERFRCVLCVYVASPFTTIGCLVEFCHTEMCSLRWKWAQGSKEILW